MLGAVVRRRDLRRAYLRGRSLRQLSTITGKSHGYIRRQLELAGTPIRTPQRFPVDPDWWSAQVEAGLDAKQIASQLSCNETTAYRHLRSLGLTRTNFDFWLGQRTRPDGTCRRWTGGHTNYGYPKYQKNGRPGVVHRLTWEHHHWPIPDGAVIAHRCEHRDCVELAHL